MPPKMASKGSEIPGNNVSWSLASENAKLLFDKNSEIQCDKLYLPKVSETVKRSTNNKSMNVSNHVTEETSIDVLVADDILCTALRIQPEEKSSMLFSSTKLRTQHWPSLIACRSIFLHHETLALCNIGRLKLRAYSNLFS